MLIVSTLLSTWLAADLAPKARQPEQYNDQWLVMLSSKVEPGHVPDGLDKAAALPGVSLARVESSSFKNLMPCYELVLAGAFASVDDARALGRTLKAAGIDYALKNAGTYVGPRPELAAACEAMRRPAPSDGVVTFAGVLGVPVPIPEEVAERALEHSPPLVPRSEESWSAPLPVQTVGPWSVGSAVDAWSYEQGKQTCAVTGFVVGVEGTPHFGWREAGLAHPPPCGTDRVVATLSCAPDVVLAPGQSIETATWTGAWQDEPAPRAWDGVPKLIALGEERASADKPLKVEWRSRAATLSGKPVKVLELTVRAGDGDAGWVCGGDAYAATYVGVVDARGKALGPLMEFSGWHLQGVLMDRTDDKVRVHVTDIITGSHRLLSGDGVQQEQARGYCDCPC